MEFAEKGSLDDFIKGYEKKQLPIPEQEIIQIINDLTEGLNFAHSNGLSNTDIKPANEFVCEDKNQKTFFKVGDWGGSVQFRTIMEQTVKLQ